MATVLGDAREPALSAIGETQYDLTIHVTDVGEAPNRYATDFICDEIEKAFPSLKILVYYPTDEKPPRASMVESASGLCRLITYSPQQRSLAVPQVRTSQEYESALSLSKSAASRVCLLLSSQESLLSPGILSALVNPVLGGELDLMVALYQTSAFEGMVNSSILYPLSRVISGRNIRYPLAPDLAVSADGQSFLLQQRLHNLAEQGHSRILWPTLELGFAGFKSGQVSVGRRSQTPAGSATLADLMTEVVGSLFSEIELKAAAWQRNLAHAWKVPSPSQPSDGPDTAIPDPLPLVESFKVGANNLQEIWRLVLPPQSLLALKRLAQLPASEFQIADTLWVRIVYDFLLAHRSRNVSRIHILGALTPLYLGWVASFVMDMTRHGQEKMEERIETLAAAFEADRGYLVSQWRWPDRFNP